MIDIKHHIHLIERKNETIIKRHKKYGKVINTVVFLVGAISTAFFMALVLEITIDQKIIVALVSLISISCGVGLIYIYKSMVHIKIRNYQSFLRELREIERKIDSTFNSRKH